MKGRITRNVCRGFKVLQRGNVHSVHMKYSNPLCDKMNGLKFKVFVIDHFGSRSRMPVRPTVKNGGSKDSMSNSAHIKLQSYYPKGG